MCDPHNGEDETPHNALFAKIKYSSSRYLVRLDQAAPGLALNESIH